MQARRATSKLAALGHLRQVEVVLRADRASDRAAAPVRSAWFRLLALLRNPPPDLWQQVRALLAPLALHCQQALAGELLATARWAHRQAASGLRRSVPRHLLARAAARRRSHLRESIDWADLLAPFRQQADASSEDGEDAPDVSLTDIGAILFPPPSDDLLTRVIHGSGWQGRLAAMTSLGTPEQLASQVQAELMLGHNPQQIARALLPYVEGVQSAARRVARTESMRVAGAMQMQAHAQLGDLVVGYQIHATLDERTRSWHAARSGTIYHANPGPGQKGYQQLPQPPDEAPDPAERPGGTPQTAYNCRCYLTPVLSDPGPVEGFTPPEPPDPLVMSDWWAGADEQRRRLAVGTRRYSLVLDQHGNAPDWEHFLSPTGGLMPTAELASERREDRAKRLEQVRAALAGRRRDAKQVSQYGWA